MRKKNIDAQKAIKLNQSKMTKKKNFVQVFNIIGKAKDVIHSVKAKKKHRF